MKKGGGTFGIGPVKSNEMINKAVIKNMAMLMAAIVAITTILTGCNASTDSSTNQSEETSTSHNANTSASTSASTLNSTTTSTSTSKPTTTTKPTKKSKSTTTTTSTKKSNANDSNVMADEVVRLVNIERKKAGVKALKTGKAGNNAAQLRAVEIEKSFSHNRPDGSSCFTVADEFNINSSAFGENIAAGHKTPEKVVEEWMKSPGHRRNILSSSYTHIGVGYYKKSGSKYTYYWTQFFYTP